MKLPHYANLALGLLLARVSEAAAAATSPAPAVPPRRENSTYYNPALPGWHSDPSCTQVDGTFYCVTSTFISFPGLPVYASRDLVNWKLASHVWSRESQLPGASWNTTGQQEGMFAATLRHRDGEFYVIGEYLGAPGGILGVIFRAADPFRDDAWSDPVVFRPTNIDPDLFWDDDGKVYVATHTVILQEIDLETGELSQPPINIWNGTGGVWPEGPHIYKKDGWYYLLIAEGGTGLNHAITIARARAVTGPYEAYEGNPILTNRGTDEYFQTVGHGDLFQGADGRWWGACLATRSGPGPAPEVYPMGRETVVFPVAWEEGEWPVLEPVRGAMSGPLPPPEEDDDEKLLPGDGPYNTDPDVYDFGAAGGEEGAPIPRNLVHWRVPREGAFATTPRGLRVAPSRNNLTGVPLSGGETPELSGQRGLAFVGRRQTDTLFRFSVDVSLSPREAGQEAGVTVFLTQVNHIDLGVVLLAPSDSTSPGLPGGKEGGRRRRRSSSSSSSSSSSELSLRFRAEAEGKDGVPEAIAVPLPAAWAGAPIRLQIETPNATHYSLSAMSAEDPESVIEVATASAQLVSGGNGSFVGSLVGVYATCNGAGTGLDCPKGGDAYFTRWRYTGIAQQIAMDEFVPSW